MDVGRFLIRQDTILRAITYNHLTHQQFADHLGLSRSYWSQVFNRRRHLTPMLRQLLLGSRLFKNVPEDELWDVVTDADAEPAAMAVAGTSS